MLGFIKQKNGDGILSGETLNCPKCHEAVIITTDRIGLAAMSTCMKCNMPVIHPNYKDPVYMSEAIKEIQDDISVIDKYVAALQMAVANLQRENDQLKKDIEELKKLKKD